MDRSWLIIIILIVVVLVVLIITNRVVSNGRATIGSDAPPFMISGDLHPIEGSGSGTYDIRILPPSNSENYTLLYTVTAQGAGTPIITFPTGFFLGSIRLYPLFGFAPDASDNWTSTGFITLDPMLAQVFTTGNVTLKVATFTYPNGALQAQVR